MSRFTTQINFLYISLFFVILPVAGITKAGYAQSDENKLDLGMSRDFGYSSGSGQIQGTFSIKAKGPENLVKVIFFIDGEVMVEDNDAPYQYQFITDNYPLGIHTLTAIGYTQDDSEIKATEIRVEFVSAEEGSKAAFRIIVPLFGTILVVGILSYAIPTFFRRGKTIPLGSPRNYTWVGGTICPKCSRPFPFNFFSLKLVVGRLDRCIHCGKWSLSRGYPIEMLRAAEQAELANAAPIEQPINQASEPEKAKKALDDSRFQDL